MSTQIASDVPLTAEDLTYLRDLADAESALQRGSQHLPDEMSKGFIDRLIASANRTAKTDRSVSGTEKELLP